MVLTWLEACIFIQCDLVPLLTGVCSNTCIDSSGASVVHWFSLDSGLALLVSRAGATCQDPIVLQRPQ